jgi:predicted porin
MKIMMYAAALAVVAPFCYSQAAEPNLALYGRFDAGISYTSAVQDSPGGGGHHWRGQSGNWGASWLGLMGKEDLGGGDGVFFVLEAGLDMMHGAGNAGGNILFGRKAYVGYQTSNYGSIRLGRDLSLGNYQWDMDPMMQELYSSTALMRWRNSLVIDNAIGYQSPVVKGFDLYVQYSPSEQSRVRGQGPAGDRGRTGAVQLTYTDPVLELRSQYSQLQDANGRYSNLFGASRELFVGVALKLNRETTLQVGHNRLSAPDTPAGLADKADHCWFGGKFQVTPRWLLSSALYRINVRGGGGDAIHDGAGHATLFAAGAMYSFSKRTFWYLSVAHVRNSDGAQFGVGARNPGSDNSNLDNPMPGQAQSGLYTGINATF